MSSLVHALLATGCIALAFYIGRFMANASMLERFFDMMTDDLLKKLHKDGFLKIEKDKDGELELITIAEVEDLARKSVQLKAAKNSILQEVKEDA